MTWMVFSNRIFLEIVFCFCVVVRLFFFNKISLTFFSKKKYRENSEKGKKRIRALCP